MVVNDVRRYLEERGYNLTVEEYINLIVDLDSSIPNPNLKLVRYDSWKNNFQVNTANEEFWFSVKPHEEKQKVLKR